MLATNDVLKSSIHDEFIKKVDGEKSLIGVLWVYLNPLAINEIEKAAVFDMLLMLVFNIAKVSEK
jgi:hypothetical protein